MGPGLECQRRAMHFGKFSDDRHPDSGPFLFSVYPLADLAENTNDIRHFNFSYAIAVIQNGQFDGVARVETDLDTDLFTLGGCLDRIADEFQDDLFHMDRVGG